MLFGTSQSSTKDPDNFKINVWVRVQVFKYLGVYMDIKSLVKSEFRAESPATFSHY